MFSNREYNYSIYDYIWYLEKTLSAGGNVPVIFLGTPDVCLQSLLIKHGDSGKLDEIKLYYLLFQLLPSIVYNTFYDPSKQTYNLEFNSIFQPDGLTIVC
jgi:hypothetical protein